MQTTSEHRPPEQDEKARLPWHKPTVERLTVNIDTSYQSGSPIDGGTGSGPG
jgi:hypothetical protein